METLEMRVGIEPTHKGFADLSLTTRVPRRNDNVASCAILGTESCRDGTVPRALLEPARNCFSNFSEQSTHALAPRSHLRVRFVDQLGYLRAGADRFHEDDLPRIQVHAVRAMQFLTPLHQYIRDLLVVRIGFAEDVVNVSQHGMATTIARQLAVIHGTITQQNSLIRCREAAGGAHSVVGHGMPDE